MSESRGTAVVMPRLGESIVEATVVRYLVAPGDRVERGQILVEIETDKASNELPAPAAGVVGALLVAPGATVPVGTVLFEIGAEPAAAAAVAAERLAPQHLVPQGPRRTSPAVRRLAREHQIDVHGLAGSGKGGRVTRDDVLRFLEGRRSTPSTPPALPRELQTPFPTALPAPIGATEPPAPARAYRPQVYRAKPIDRAVPFSRRRKQIAEHMIHSLGTSAHVAAVAEIDVSRVLAARAVDAPAAEAAGIKLTILPYLLQAVTHALREHPELNAVVQDETLILRGERNLGVAVDTAEGLIVPVIQRADELGLLGLARRLSELSEKARAGGLTPEDLSGGSFTVSNPGKDGNLFGISIIRQPEVAILRIGSIVKRPVVREIDGEDAIVIRPIVYAALSYDHRVIDGRTGNAFLHRVTELVQQARPGLG